MKLVDNPLIEIFKKKKYINIKNLELFHKGTRDNKKINVLIDKSSGILILNKSIDTIREYYENNEIYSSKEEEITLLDIKTKVSILNDDKRRFDVYKNFTKNKAILDFGCGKGAFLRYLYTSKNPSEIYGLELNKVNSDILNKKGIKCFNSDIEIPKFKKFDYIFLNHVFEHLSDPLELISSLLKRIKSNGNIIIEIPHSDDFLIKETNNIYFRNFTFWSEHLCLYNENFLTKIMIDLKVKKFSFAYFQRYGINNHFNWLINNKPGGHDSYDFFDKQSDGLYRKNLIKKKKTDTLFLLIGPQCNLLKKRIENKLS
jgi:2-polyprenyl-3-methyl-5-hydroxy-6-metoxy-1,4-benzoquinol methylase